MRKRETGSWCEAAELSILLAVAWVGAGAGARTRAGWPLAWVYKVKVFSTFLSSTLYGVAAGF